MGKNLDNYWNYRVVVEQEPDLVDKGNFVESVSFRDVYYKNGKPTSWGSEPQHPIGETVRGMLCDIRLMSEALLKPPLVVRGDEIMRELRYSSEELEEIKRMVQNTRVQENNKSAEKLANQIRDYGYTAVTKLHEYEVEERKKELQHNIEKARMMNDFDKEKELIQAFKKFSRDMEAKKLTQRQAMEHGGGGVYGRGVITKEEDLF